MKEAIRTTLRNKLVVEYSEILIKARRGHKGLRMAYLYSIQLLGSHPEGLKLCDICRITGKVKGNIHKRLVRCMSAGFIHKDNMRYYLTDSGLKVYSTICREFDSSMNEIIEVLVSEARKKM